MSYYSKYRWCAVPECTNTSIKTPGKLWIRVPADKNKRKAWFEAARRDPQSLDSKSRLYFCEDHFDLEHDMENYIRYKIMGSVKKIQIKSDCVPSRFEWQRKLKSSSVRSHHTEANKPKISTSKDDIEDTVNNSSSCIEGTVPPEQTCEDILQTFKINKVPRLSAQTITEEIITIQIEPESNKVLLSPDYGIEADNGGINEEVNEMTIEDVKEECISDSEENLNCDSRQKALDEEETCMENLVPREDDTTLKPLESNSNHGSSTESENEIQVLCRIKGNDQYDTFGSYIASMLRRLPTKKALMLQPKIVNLLIAASVEELE